MAMAVSITMVMVRIRPTRPGTMLVEVRRSGLYQITGSSEIGRRTCVTIISIERAWARPAAVFEALATVCGSLPSTTSCSRAAPRRRSLP